MPENNVVLTCGLGFVPSLRDSPHNLIPPGTDVPGYRLFRPYGDWFFATSAEGYVCRKSEHAQGLKPGSLWGVNGPTKVVP